ncbi:MAG TPA: efflux RND transporter periplasmic adaptor subunit [Gammaproteobacteria bacterium]|nr:efflux RND transporter periplasmic adaptor subunit [Gammaproteobacteria bacterium]
MIKRMIIVIVALVVVFGGVIGFNAFKGYMIAQAMAKFANPPQTVSAMKAPVLEWRPTLRAVGSLRAVQGVDVTTELGGLVAKIDFNSGDHVKAGDLLVQLDVSADKAQLQGLKAAAQLAETTYKRDEGLIKKRAISQSQLDQDLSRLKSARAAVVEQQATIAKKTIRAPFDGELGVRQVDLGQYVAPGTKIVTLQNLHPIYVEFSLPQQDVNDVHDAQPVTVTVNAYPNATFEGKVNAIDPKVDPQTRNFKLQAIIPNKDERLRPGMFADVQVSLPNHPKYVTLPQMAISYNPYGDFVWIVTPKKGEDGKQALTVRQQFVQTGPTRGDQVAILKGVKPGEMVVTAGQIKLKKGTPVIINNSVPVPFSPNPQVEEE